MLESPVSQHIWSPNWEKVPGRTSSPWVRLQRLQFGFSFMIPEANWYHCQSEQDCSTGSDVHFFTMLFALFCKSWNVAKSGSVWPDLLQGLTSFQDLLPIYCVSLLTLRAGVAGTHSSSQGSVQVGQKRGQRPALFCLWSLHKIIYLISLTLLVHVFSVDM